MDTKSTRTGGVRLPPAMYDRLRKEAYERHVSQNDIIVEALARYFEIAGYDRRKGEVDA